MKPVKKYAQSTIEYVMVISIVIAALFSMYKILHYLAMGRLQLVSDYVVEREGIP